MFRFEALVALAAVASLSAAAAAQPARYEITLLPALETPFGPFDEVEGLAINNRGVVAGRACGALDPFDRGCGAFRTRRGALVDLDPDGAYSSSAIALNKRGVVLGSFSRDGEKVYFKALRNGRVRLLEGGLPRRESGRPYGSFARDFNDRGAAVVDVLFEDGPRPYVYRDSAGSWEPLTAGEPEFDGPVLFGGFNNRGDSVLVTATEQGSAAYLYLRDRSIVVIRPPGEGHFTLGRPTRAGAVSGRITHSTDLLDEAVYFDRAGGLRSIHPQGFRQSFALQTLEDGTALVGASRGALHAPTVFYFTYHPDEGLRQLWSGAELRDLRQRAGCRKPNRNHFFPPRLNRRGEAVLTLFCISGRGVLHYSRETGFTLLNEVLEAAGLGRQASVLGRDLNDRGQLLFDAFIDGSARSVVLTPVR